MKLDRWPCVGFKVFQRYDEVGLDSSLMHGRSWQELYLRSHRHTAETSTAASVPRDPTAWLLDFPSDPRVSLSNTSEIPSIPSISRRILLTVGLQGCPKAAK